MICSSCLRNVPDLIGPHCDLCPACYGIDAEDFVPSLHVALSIVCVDPRNQLYLLPKLWRDVLCYRPGWKASCQTALQAFALPAVIVNGQTRSRKGEIDPDELCHLIGGLLGIDVTNEEPTHG